MHPHPDRTPHGAMRRVDREITDRREIDEILHGERIMHLGMCDAGSPLVLPLYYVYDGAAISFHSARAGSKIRILQADPRVCFAVMSYQGVIPSDEPCDFEARHRTVVGFGRAEFIEDAAEKERSLQAIIARFTDRRFALPPERVRGTHVVRIAIASLTGKKHGM